MRFFYPIDKKPEEYMRLLILTSSLVLFNGEIYKQAITRNNDFPKYNLYFENKKEYNYTDIIQERKLLSAEVNPSGDYGSLSGTSHSLQILGLGMS